MLTLAELKRASWLKRAYGEAVPGFMDHDAQRFEGPAGGHHTARFPEASAEDVSAGRCLTVEYDPVAKEYICR